jgi:hypothetical protein
MIAVKRSVDAREREIALILTFFLASDRMLEFKLRKNCERRY